MAASLLATSGMAVLERSHSDQRNSGARTASITQFKLASTLNPLQADYIVNRAYYMREQNMREQNRALAVDKVAIRDGLPSPAILYRQALELRPHSGHIWAQYAKALYADVGDINGATSALERALTLAPYQPAVLDIGIDLGVTVWDELQPHQRNMVGRSIDYLLHNNRHYLD